MSQSLPAALHAIRWYSRSTPCYGMCETKASEVNPRASGPLSPAGIARFRQVGVDVQDRHAGLHLCGEHGGVLSQPASGLEAQVGRLPIRQDDRRRDGELDLTACAEVRHN